MIEQTRFVERIQFFEGQRLFAEDLQAIDAFNREMRWLHNRSLHQPGIGSGLAVTGQKGDRQVTINPGYAIDKEGREIVLTQPQVLQVPPVGGGADGRPAVFDLTIAFPEDDALEEAETRRGVCGATGVVRLREAPVFCWVELKSDDPNSLYVESRFQQEILEATKIILGRVAVRNCRLDHFIDLRVRRDARPNCLPYIACGIETNPKWERKNTNGWAYDRLCLPRMVFTAAANTSTANFQAAPRYQVQVMGAIEMQVQVETEGTAPSTVNLDIVLACEIFIKKMETRLLEIITVIVPIFLDSEAASSVSAYEHSDTIIGQIEQRIKDTWSIQWMGVEG